VRTGATTFLLTKRYSARVLCEDDRHEGFAFLPVEEPLRALPC